MVIELPVGVKPAVWNGDRGVNVPLVTLKVPAVIIGAAVTRVIAQEPLSPDEVIAPVLIPLPEVAPAIMVTLPPLVLVVPEIFTEPGL